MADLFELAHPPKGTVRRDDHSTSRAAAVQVKRTSLRQIVLDYAARRRDGFTDHDLWALRPETPESSLRKRRSELVEENRLLDTGRVRTNGNGQEAKVWIDRAFHHNPPPIVEREQKISSAEQIKRLETRVASMERAMREAIAVHQNDAGFSSTSAQMADILTANLPS